MKKYKRIYLDMDGVIADFDKAFKNLTGQEPKDFEEKHGQVAFWSEIYETRNFFLNMPAFDYLAEMVGILSGMCQKLVILSSPSKTNESLCIAEKRAWLDRNIGIWQPAIFERDKHIYSRQGCLLIDDTQKKVDKFNQGEGEAYLFTSFSKFLDDFVGKKEGGDE